jgi:hypothetical protein
MEVIGVSKTKPNYEANSFLFEVEASDQLMILIIGLLLSTFL